MNTMSGPYGEMPWLKSYALGPFKLKHSMEPYPEVNVYSFLENAAEEFPDNIACVYLDEETTYPELKDKVDRLASALERLGVKKGDVVASVLPSCPEVIVVDYACMKLGVVHAPLSILHKAAGLLHELKECRAETVICSQRRVVRVREVQAETSVKTIIYTPTRVFPDYNTPEPIQEEQDSFLLEDLIRQSEPLTTRVEINAKEDVALLPFTGGTTGEPKGTMLTHYNLTSNVVQTIHWMMQPLQAGLRGKGATALCVPIYHMYGHWAIHASISWGLKMFLLDPRDMVRIVDVINEKRPAIVFAVPAHYTFFLKMPLKKGQIFYYSAAAALPPELAEEFEKVAGLPMGEGYGATEASGGATVNISAFSRVTGFMKEVKRGVGVPLPDTQVRVVDPETGEDCPPGEPGELWIRGPQCMLGYWPKTGMGLTPEGWLRMGDVVVMDSDGYFTVVDRIKDMINVSGNKVYSRLVDDALHEHPAVEFAGVIGVPDPERKGSERVKAFIQLKPEFKGRVTEEEIIEHLRGKLQPYEIPKYVEFRDVLPLTHIMKIHKKVLREEELGDDRVR